MSQDYRYKIVCIDDDPEILQLLGKQLSNAGYEPLLIGNSEDAVTAIDRDHPNILLVISDYKMPGLNGFELRAKLLTNHPDIPFAIVSGYVTKEMALQGIEHKICAFVSKPMQWEELYQVIQKETATRLETLKEERELLAGFLDESANMMEELEDLITSLEVSPHDPETLNGMFRILHTIKGLSGFFQPDTINRFAHRTEDYLSRFKNGQAEVTPSVVQTFLKAYDILNNLMDDLRQENRSPRELDPLVQIFDTPSTENSDVTSHKEKGAQAGETASPSARKEAPRDWVKAPIALLDKFMRRSGENTVLRNMVNKLVRSIELQIKGSREVAELAELLDEMHEINAGTQNDIMELRKVPVKDVYRPLQRTVREICQSLNKKAELSTVGDEMRVDTAIADVLRNSLIHMIRNSLDHGLESPEDRLSAGKEELGSLNIHCFEEGENIEVEIRDDGRGIDPEKIRKKLLEKGFMDAEQLAKLHDKEVLVKIFESGFSTAQQITDVSGRGIGMDQVKESVEKLGGSIEVDSEIGKGTRIRLHLPVPKSVEIITSMIVRVDSRQFAIPRAAVVRIVQIDCTRQIEMVRELQNSVFISVEDHLVPLVWLADLLHIETANKQKVWQSQVLQERNTLQVVILKEKDLTYALAVDEILDSEETVVKNLPEFLSGHGIFSGSTFQGDGLPGLILNVKGLAKQNGILKKSSEYAENTAAVQGQKRIASLQGADTSEFLMVKLANGRPYAIPLTFVNRLENFDRSHLQSSGETRVINYRNKVLPLVWINQFLGYDKAFQQQQQNQESLPTVIIEQDSRQFGLVVESILDVKAIGSIIDDSIRDRNGILGNIIFDSNVVVVIDVWQVINQETQKLGLEDQGSSKNENPLRSKCHILYAEDVGFYREYIKKGLVRAGFKVTAVASGEEAWDHLKSQKTQNFSLLLTDIQMPGMNGLELAQAVRDHESLSSFPVLALTAHKGNDLVEAGKSIGIDAYIEKMNISQVVEAIDTLLPLENRRSA